MTDAACGDGGERVAGLVREPGGELPHDESPLFLQELLLGLAELLGPRAHHAPRALLLAPAERALPLLEVRDVVDDPDQVRHLTGRRLQRDHERVDDARSPCPVRQQILTHLDRDARRDRRLLAAPDTLGFGRGKDVEVGATTSASGASPVVAAKAAFTYTKRCSRSLTNTG
jgi:hypothetical protein